MAKKQRRQRPYPTTKKHIARQEKERRQNQIIIIGTAVVVTAAILLIAIPYLIQSVIQPGQPVAIVNEEEISTGDWQTQTKYFRFNIIRSIENNLQLAQLFGDDPNTAASLTSQVQPLLGQLNPATIAGQATLDQMIDDTLIRQEAHIRGVEVTEDEVEEGDRQQRD